MYYDYFIVKNLKERNEQEKNTSKSHFQLRKELFLNLINTYHCLVKAGKYLNMSINNLIYNIQVSQF